MNAHDMRRRLIKDNIERSGPPTPDENPFLSEKKLRFVAAWTGNLIAAARAAGYRDPKSAAYKLMKDPEVVQALQTKQEAMLQESGEHLARTLPLSRADVIDRLWELAQLAPERTNRNITGQVKAAQALEQIFALNIDGNDLLKRQLQDKSEAEIQFYVVHGFLPYPEEQKPAQLASAEAPQLPQSTTEQQSPTLEVEALGGVSAAGDSCRNPERSEGSGEELNEVGKMDLLNTAGSRTGT